MPSLMVPTVTPTKSRAATENFGDYLRRLMANAGMKRPADLSKAAGVNHANLGRWLDGTGLPSIEALRRIAPHLGVSLVALMIRAEYLTREEAGGGAEGPPLPAVVRDIIMRLAAPQTARHRQALLNHLAYSLELFDEVVEQVANSPREPRMRQR